MKNSYKSDKHTNRMWSGLILLLVGLFFLSRNFGFFLPQWLFSWHVILMVIGIIVGAKRNFIGGGWLVMVLIGGFFTLQRFSDLNFSTYYFPGIFIILGLYLILSPSRRLKKNNPFGDRPSADFKGDPLVNPVSDDAGIQDDQHGFSSGAPTNNTGDVIDLVNVFSGSKQQFYSKNLLGGEVVVVFSGAELNFIQSDFENTIAIEITAIFGGVKLIIPPHWVVKSEVTPIFGGLNDRRAVVTHIEGNPKVLVIRGTALLGGIDISNF